MATTDTGPATAATVDDLYQVRGKAELVGGRLQLMEPAGDSHGAASLAIASSLRAHARRTGAGVAYADNVGFLVDLPHRHSFSPDAAFHTGPRTGHDFLQGAPAFAVEIRSKGDYGRTPERELRDKRADYFAAGTLVVWDVDLASAAVIRVYRDNNPDTPAAIYQRGETAEAEPAVPTWRFPVDDLFD
ncbi:MAG TPA: Uma2 family endonuclease [Chloroflexota bacterium]|nr:Uma2 family endonuclease [Chloroflexota bacterium]